MKLASGTASGSALALAASYWLFMSPYSQLLGPFPYRARTSEKVAALTFDDGPNEPHTSRIAEFLGARGISATFFQVGKCVERYPQVTARLARDGHVIGNHSYAHEFTTALDGAALRADLKQAHDVFGDVLGRQPLLYRPPWLLRTPTLLRALTERSLRPVSGEFCHPLEVFQPPAGLIARRTLAKARPGCMIIFHDGFDSRGGDRSSTVDAVKLVVDGLTEAGYHFTTVDRLLGLPAYSTAGR